MTLAEIEKRAIKAEIKRCGGDIVLAARKLGIGKTTVYRKLKEYRQQRGKSKSRKGRRTTKRR